jgi:hypothetical protein
MRSKGIVLTFAKFRAWKVSKPGPCRCRVMKKERMAWVAWTANCKKDLIGGDRPANADNHIT